MAEIFGERTTSPLTPPHSGEVINVASAADVLPLDEQVKRSAPVEPASASLPASERESVILICEAPSSAPLAPPQSSSAPPAPPQSSSAPLAPPQSSSAPPAPPQSSSAPPAPPQSSSAPPAPPQSSSAPPAPPQPKESDIVEAPAPPKTTPPQEAEPITAPESEVKSELDKTCQSAQKRCKQTGQLLFCIPPMEEVQQKKAEKVSKSTEKKENKEKRRRRPGHLLFCIPPTEEDQQKTEKASTLAEPTTSPVSWTRQSQSLVSWVFKTRSQEKPRKRVGFCLTLIEEEQDEAETTCKLMGSVEPSSTSPAVSDPETASHTHCTAP
ncbi:hypothetical protein PGIGA_G00050730 [Pangasianodon gigas]|uniref:Uncharacterized protein n=1 Tax=Pangasianodon gigas TaxID=30993 RepID=A0ACC5X376_PANGG|nr:hypothetical protein [Pangasianodon gigas]